MTLRSITWHAVTVVATLLVLLVVWQIGVAVAILLASLALGACMYPLVEHLQERGWPRGIAIAMMVAGSLAIVLGFCGALAVPVAIDLQQLGTDLTDTLERLAAEYPDHWLVQSFRPAEPPAVEGDAPPTAPPRLAWMRSLVGTATELVQLGAHAAICIALSVYWTIDRQRIERLWLSLVPVKRRPAAQKTWQAVERELGAYLRSELAQGLLAAMLLWAGFELLGLRYAALAALIAAVLVMIPWLGNLFAIAVVMVMASGKLANLDDPWITVQGWLAVAYLAVVLGFLQFVIEPRLFNQDRYNSLWTVLTTLALTFTFGVWGLIFGPPVGYGIQIVLRQLHPLFFYEPAQHKSFGTIEQKLAELRERYPRSEETPPEVISFLDRLEVIVESRSVAEAR